MTFELIDCAFHRNGISGEGFWNVLFFCEMENRPREPFHAVVLDEEVEEATGTVCVAINRVGALAGCDAGDTFRGDAFADGVRCLIKDWKFENTCGGVA